LLFLPAVNRTATPPDPRRWAHLWLAEEFAVILRSTSAAFVFALLAINGVALAQDNDSPEGQLPPLEQPAPAEQSEQLEKPKCVTSNTAWKEKGNVVTLRSSCKST
jgi:hypothetical protein